MLGRLITVKQIKAVTEKRLFRTAERWFKRFPFLVIVFTGFTPVPYAPFRVIAVSSRYPIDRYIVAVLVGRTPRDYLWALLGSAIDIPLWGYGLIFVPFLAVPALAAFVSWRKRRSIGGTHPVATELMTGTPG